MLSEYQRVRLHANALGLSQNKVMILLALSEGELCVQDIAKQVISTQQSVGKSLKQMQGYVSVTHDPNDRRAKIVRLLAKGRRTIEKLEREWNARSGD